MDPKGGELFVRELTSEETLTEDLCVTDVQFVHFTREQGRKTNRTTQQLVPPEVSPRIAGEIFIMYSREMIGGQGDVCPSPTLKLQTYIELNT